uniref:Uncharacterized protein n=1 Tax=Chromera velia CCMP2878 TaxID=1169474 RepID=A0A0G4H5C1_9ALVE|eukprot:Cvel_24718.t1-p1 / transcript=Cvel_24718.t1 / gene=Cvel_24718 / organism=Chromera_velia_CCMP2878 / gene_product=hypothetical protein / transcript_product=hypothetical protein / location=Cvel_scaffold2712:12129-12464(-) / protein_length=112 / sequence_SO=supercontig / SO=protein_coding / is_pseudo=false
MQVSVSGASESVGALSPGGSSDKCALGRERVPVREAEGVEEEGQTASQGSSGDIRRRRVSGTEVEDAEEAPVVSLTAAAPSKRKHVSETIPGLTLSGEGGGRGGKAGDGASS